MFFMIIIGLHNLLLDAHQSKNDLNLVLFDIIKNNKVGKLKKLIKSNGDCLHQSENVFSLLHCAASYNSLGIAELLIENGADIEEKDTNGSTVLHFAVKDNSVKVIKLLIKMGADIEAQDKDGNAPLHVAACYDSIKAAQILLDAGASLNVENNQNFTPITSSVLSSLKMYDLLTSYIDKRLSVSELEYIQTMEVLKEKRLIPELIIKSITNSTQVDLFLACGKNGSQNFLLKPGDSIDVDAFWGGDHLDVPVLSKLKGLYDFCNFTVMLEKGYPDYYTKCFSGVALSIDMHNSNQDQIESNVDRVFIKYSGSYLNNDEYGFKCCSDYLYSQVVASASDTIAFHIDIRECELPIKENPDKMMQVKFFCFYTHE